MRKKLFILIVLVASLAAQNSSAQTKKSKSAPTATPSSHSNTTAAASNETIAIKGGKLLTITHGVIENGVVVMHNGTNHRGRRSWNCNPCRRQSD